MSGSVNTDCCNDSPIVKAVEGKATRNVLVVGSPNSGKTTLYNWLTGLNSKTVNYPGATVEYSIGAIQNALSDENNSDLFFIDTPGIYSLDAQSDDERVTLDILKHKHNLKYNAIVLVLDSTQMNRQLLLAKNLIASAANIIVVLTMNDLVEQEGKAIQLNEIKSFLGATQVLLFDGLLGKGLKEVVQTISETPTKNMIYNHVHFNEAKKISELQMISEFVTDKAFKSREHSIDTKQKENKSQLEFTLKVDKWLMHPVLGYVFFFSLMTLFFASIYWMSAPIMDFVDGLTGSLIDLAKQKLPGLTGEFVGDGLIAAIGGVVIFVPQIFILFLGIGLFENTGYLSRVAALIDGPLRKVGLGGRSFVPMLSGFACAIPALMATRNITSKKEKLIAQMIIPIMSCSARLPVYGLMIGFLFREENPFLAGFVMAALYFFSILIGATVSAVLAKIIKMEQPSRLMMDLPFYRKPRLKSVISQSVHKSVMFVKRAGPIIATLAIVLWFATTFPKSEDETSKTYAMRAADFIEPVFKPLGVDGRVGFAILASFAAREVFVPSLAISLHADTGGDDENTLPILDKMHQATFNDGSPIFTVASIVGILIFFVIATQCLSTVGVLKKESGSWKWTMIQLIGSNVFAYILASVVVQILKSLGY